MFKRIAVPVLFFSILSFCASAQAADLKLQDLIQEVIKNNPEILAAQAGVQVSEYKIPQAGALPDPMFMFGYQNEGYSNYTFGEMPDAQWMFSASQMFPFWGKRALKSEMASQEAESIKASSKNIILKTISRVKELYFDLLLAYKTREQIQGKTDLFTRIEDAALARYASGMAPQQEVLMAQTEKYMLLEKDEMVDQKIQAAEGMLNSSLGRDVQSPLGRPQVPSYTPYSYQLPELLKMAMENSPEIKAREKMIKGAEARVRMAEKEYYPDFTLGANLFKRSGEFEDMWSLTAQINVPLFYAKKQRQGVLEAKAALSQNKQELLATLNMLASNLRDSYSMIKSAERLMTLYKEGLIPKTVQDFQLALSGYTVGKVEAITVISRLKALLDFELLYWGQFAEREKAMARIEAIAGITDLPMEDKKN
ncbi:MAG: TolC family protein [Deltaproteobacteria bacterium]|nr:TolC family protein [Deltaproteobacteria bacterium]